jgi:hypothetical protein
MCPVEGGTGRPYIPVCNIYPIYIGELLTPFPNPRLTLKKQNRWEEETMPGRRAHLFSLPVPAEYRHLRMGAYGENR